MHRELLNTLIEWKAKTQRKPLLIDGARQTGKTYLLKDIFAEQFDHAWHFDFLERPDLRQAFDGSLAPSTVISNLELITGSTINPESDLLIFDEIGECDRAVTSLKYFAENTPNYFVCASGSNIGLLDSFPVGKVEQHKLQPLTFREFLLAGGNNALIKSFDQRTNNKAVHSTLWDQLTDYYFVGGMPEAVKRWFSSDELGINQRLNEINQIHSDLIEGYRRDFGKYAGKVNAQLIEAVFNHIPIQLASSHVDQSVKRFKFKDVYPKKSRYADFESAIHWLQRCRLALANHPIEGRPLTPLSAHCKMNLVKLFLFDVGLLNHMLGSNYREIKAENYQYKGYIAESFVQQEFSAIGIEPSYSWNHASKAAIEFIVTDSQGRVVPVEVKSGQRTKAQSLRSFVERYNPYRTIKLTGTQGSPATEQQHIVLPLYFAQHIRTLLD